MSNHCVFPGVFVILSGRSKSLSQNPCSPVGDPGTRKVQKRHIVTDFFLPANEQTTEAVHPTMSSFHYPPPGPITWNRLRCLFFLSLAPFDWDMSRVTILRNRLTDLLVIVRLIATEMLR